MNAKMKKAHRTITTFAGTVPGASHYMGRIRIGREEVDVEQEVTPAIAKALNKDARRNGDDFRYSVGGTSARFMDRESLVVAALEFMANTYPDVILFEGDSCVMDPQQVLIGPQPFKTEANRLVAEAVVNDWWEGDEPTMEAISKRWDALMKANGLR